MGVRQGRLEVQGELLVELIVVLLLDLARLLAPDGGLAVGLLFFIAQVDREGDEIGVLADDLAQVVLLSELFGVFL